MNNLTEKEIDKIVVAQADEDDAWEKPILVNRKKTFSLGFPTSSEIVSDENVLSGTPVFRGTNVPISALIDNLENGVSLVEFLEKFPTVKREQVVEVLEYFKSTLNNIKKAA